MYVITNRKIRKGNDLSIFGKTPNSEGPLGLRLVEVTKTNNARQTTVLKNKLSKTQVTTLKNKHNLQIDESEDWYASLSVACELFERATNEKKSIVFFVHGYNNDIEDILKSAEQIEKAHDVIVVPFSWPANGGGAITGTAAYLSDKADARASEGALNRAVQKIQFYHNLLIAGMKQNLQAKAAKKHSNNHQAAQALFTELMNKQCCTTLNLLCHSMGNYVLKKTLLNGDSATSKLVFDNVCLVAADTNNENHANWVENLDVRKRVYVVINENDFALKASRIKPGDEQKARLGHYLKKLDGDNAYYINVTDANEVDSKHTYFVGDAMQNSALKKMFTTMFKGNSVEDQLKFKADNNTYIL